VSGSPTELRAQEPDVSASSSSGAGGGSGSKTVAKAAGIGVGAVVMAGLAVAVLVVRRRKSSAASASGGGEWGVSAAPAQATNPRYMGGIGDDLEEDHRVPVQFAASHHGESPMSAGMGGARGGGARDNGSAALLPHSARSRQPYPAF
jgi:hypothetical protein